MTEKKNRGPNDGGSQASDEQVADLRTISTGYVRPKDRDPYDHTVTFEEYHYYAQRTREEEKAYESPSMDWKALLFGKKEKVETSADGAVIEGRGRTEISDEEWVNANRVLRLTSWGSCEIAIMLVLFFFFFFFFMDFWASADYYISRLLPYHGRHSGAVEYWIRHWIDGLGTG